VKEWFNQKVEEVLGLGMMIWQLLKQGGMSLAQIGQMAWEGIKAAIPPALIQILIEKLVSMIVPAAGAVMAIVEGLQAAWGTVSRILQAIEKFMAFMKAVKSGGAGPQFGAMLAAAGIVLIDFVSNWLLKRVRGAASKVGGKLKAIAKKIGDKLKKAAKKVGQKLKGAAKKVGQKLRGGMKKVRDKFGKLKEKFFGKKDDKDNSAKKQEKLSKAMDAAVVAVNRFANKPVKKLALKPILYGIKLRYGLKVLEPVKDGENWAIHGKINPDETRKTEARILVIGDNTFEYSRTLQDKPGMEGTHITATGIESEDEVRSLLKNVNDPKLQEFPRSTEGFDVRHEVDATKLQQSFPGLQNDERFDRIIFNNPQAGGRTDKGKKTGELIEGVLGNSPDVLKPGGEVTFGVTSSSRALGRDTLEGLRTAANGPEGHVVINGRKFSVQVITKDKSDISVDYSARRTTGGTLRQSRGPSFYYVFKLLE
jgi:Skp family chaperone for outer membrane proteins